MNRKSVEEIDEDILFDLVESGVSKKDIAASLECSTSTLSKKLADLRTKQGILLDYRTLQSLQLTELQAKVLEAITPEKIEEAPLRDLVYAFKTLKDKELVTDGKPSEIKGLVAYLIEMEKQESIKLGSTGEVTTVEVLPGVSEEDFAEVSACCADVETEDFLLE